MNVNQLPNYDKILDRYFLLKRNTGVSEYYNGKYSEFLEVLCLICDVSSDKLVVQLELDCK